MKKILYLLFIVTSVAMAQKGDRIKAYKTAYITDALDLTPSEAEKFWPVYNEYEEKFMELRIQERKEIFETIKGNFDNLSDEQASLLLEKSVAIKEKEFEYHKALLQKLKGILPAKKILKLKRAEEEFKRTLLDKMKNRKGGRP